MMHGAWCMVHDARFIQSLGASGAIFGLCGAEAVLLMHVSLWAFLESIGRIAVFAVVVAVVVPNIDHMAHLGVSGPCCSFFRSLCQGLSRASLRFGKSTEYTATAHEVIHRKQAKNHSRSRDK